MSYMISYRTKLLSGDVRSRLGPAMAGLAHVIAGGAFAADGTVEGWSPSSDEEGPAPRRLLGWTAGRHWMLASADR